MRSFEDGQIILNDEWRPRGAGNLKDGGRVVFDAVDKEGEQEHIHVDQWVDTLGKRVEHILIQYVCPKGEVWYRTELRIGDNVRLDEYKPRRLNISDDILRTIMDAATHAAAQRFSVSERTLDVRYVRVEISDKPGWRDGAKVYAQFDHLYETAALKRWKKDERRYRKSHPDSSYDSTMLDLKPDGSDWHVRLINRLLDNTFAFSDDQPVYDKIRQH